MQFLPLLNNLAAKKANFKTGKQGGSVRFSEHLDFAQGALTNLNTSEKNLSRVLSSKKEIVRDALKNLTTEQTANFKEAKAAALKKAEKGLSGLNKDTSKKKVSGNLISLASVKAAKALQKAGGAGDASGTKSAKTKQTKESSLTALVEEIFEAAKSEKTGKAAKQELTAAVAAALGGKKGKDALKDLKMTREDFAALKEGLREFGFSEKEIEALGDEITSESGLTWGRFISGLAEKINTPGQNASAIEMTPAENRNLLNFFQKLGFTPQKSIALAEDLKNGKSSDVWRAVDEKISKLPKDAEIVLEAAEVKVLAKVMKLSAPAKAVLKNLLGGAKSLKLGTGELKAVLARVKQEAANDARDQDTRESALKEFVAEGLRRAGNKAETEALADKREDGTAQRNKALAEQGNRNARGKSGENTGSKKSGKAPADFGKGEEGGKANRLFSSEPVEPETGEDVSRTNQDREESLGRFKDVEKNTSKEHGAKDNAQTKGRDSGEEDSAWKDFWGKIKKDGSVLEAGQGLKGLHSGAEVSQDRAPDVISRMENISPREVLRQVEAGIIKNLGQGRQQITLRLNPPELGRVNVVLQVVGKEVRALIRAENQDASKMIGDQLAHLRQGLEQQGLKVTKLEVQTQLPDGQLAQNWHGADKHNLARQQNDASWMRGNRTPLQDEADDLAQEMQNPAERVKISQEGLDIFA